MNKKMNEIKKGTDMGVMIKDLYLRKSAILEGALDFQWIKYKGKELEKFVTGSLAIFPERKEVSIQSITSKFQNQGHGQEFVELLKADVESNEYKLVSSVALSPAWKHICDKLGIKIYD